MQEAHLGGRRGPVRPWEPVFWSSCCPSWEGLGLWDREGPGEVSAHLDPGLLFISSLWKQVPVQSPLAIRTAHAPKSRGSVVLNVDTCPVRHGAREDEGRACARPIDTNQGPRAAMASSVRFCPPVGNLDRRTRLTDGDEGAPQDVEGAGEAEQADTVSCRPGQQGKVSLRGGPAPRHVCGHETTDWLLHSESRVPSKARRLCDLGVAPIPASCLSPHTRPSCLLPDWWGRIELLGVSRILCASHQL